MLEKFLFFVGIVGVLTIVIHYLLKRFAKDLHDKIDAKLEEWKSKLGGG